MQTASLALKSIVKSIQSIFAYKFDIYWNNARFLSMNVIVPRHVQCLRIGLQF